MPSHSRGKSKPRTEQSSTPSSTWQSVSHETSPSSRTAWESSTRPTVSSRVAVRPTGESIRTFGKYGNRLPSGTSGESLMIGNNGADALANHAAKSVGPTIGQGKIPQHATTLQLCATKTQAKILEQVRIVEAMPINGQNREKQDLSGHTV
eukprot:9532499-Heterocapsa_arctica.AAC.1